MILKENYTYTIHACREKICSKILNYVVLTTMKVSKSPIKISSEAFLQKMGVDYSDVMSL